MEMIKKCMDCGLYSRSGRVCPLCKSKKRITVQVTEDHMIRLNGIAYANYYNRRRGAVELSPKQNGTFYIYSTKNNKNVISYHLFDKEHIIMCVKETTENSLESIRKTIKCILTDGCNWQRYPNQKYVHNVQMRINKCAHFYPLSERYKLRVWGIVIHPRIIGYLELLMMNGGLNKPTFELKLDVINKINNVSDRHKKYVEEKDEFINKHIKQFKKTVEVEGMVINGGKING